MYLKKSGIISPLTKYLRILQAFLLGFEYNTINKLITAYLYVPPGYRKQIICFRHFDKIDAGKEKSSFTDKNTVFVYENTSEPGKK